MWSVVPTPNIKNTCGGRNINARDTLGRRWYAAGMTVDKGTFEKALNLFERGIVLVTGIAVVTTMLYVAGNYQNFAETTQVLLLELTRIFAGSAVVGAGIAALLEIPFLIVHRRWGRLRRLAALILAVLLVGSILAGSTAIIVLQQPL